ncbi:MAG: hypothetical protein NXY57DRAFT_1107255 [Lentinula lateritia]|uniref:Vacuolar ATPase assembly integral membrane protein VMA21 n=1 Tax=Lentinula lateritia TaxID=40482 RepID=A0ABQ8V9L3_9AGAR|nr:MAG: hypothetical protein NXY57DRAFT_1107255 [Lentinula lateritia]KAJ4482660.1 hypothetical protein C8R41DRAFT_922045 [Lentinula lateritia]
MSTSEQAAIGKLNTNTASNGTLSKLVIFSLSLGIVPLTSYYGSLHYLWNGNSTFAAITAVVAANVVLIAYIILSILEDKQSSISPTRISAQAPESKKER